MKNQGAQCMKGKEIGAQGTKSSETPGIPGKPRTSFHLVCKTLGGAAGAGKASSKRKKSYGGSVQGCRGGGHVEYVLM